MTKNKDRSEQTINILKGHGAVISDSHVVLTSGKHSDFYVNKDRIYAYPEEISKICLFMAERFINIPVEVVAGPAMGGIILSQWVAYHLTKLKNKKVYSVFTDKVSKDQIFKRGYDRIVKGKNVLVVEDLTTTGGSVRKSVDSVTKAGGKVIAVSIIGNRRTDVVTSKIVGAPLYALANFDTVDYDEKDCPWCKENRPINTNVGHGKEYLKSKKKNDVSAKA